MSEKTLKPTNATAFLAQKSEGILQGKESSGPLPLKRIQSQRHTKQMTKLKAVKPKIRAQNDCNDDQHESHI